jgi:hypothetical protein
LLPVPGSGGTVSFKYDPFGRRIYKSSSSETSIYAYDGSNLAEETSSSGAVLARYSQGLNVDQPLAMLRAGTTSYYEADGLGSVTSLTRSGRYDNTELHLRLVWKHRFRAFGNLPRPESWRPYVFTSIDDPRLDEFLRQDRG